MTMSTDPLIGRTHAELIQAVNELEDVYRLRIWDSVHVARMKNAVYRFIEPMPEWGDYYDNALFYSTYPAPIIHGKEHEAGELVEALGEDAM